MKNILFFDLEVDTDTEIINEYGGLLGTFRIYTKQANFFQKQLRQTNIICSHNLFGFDIKYLKKTFPEWTLKDKICIDTLCLSPLLFPHKQYHNLDKDYKLNSDAINDPLADSMLTKEVFHDCISAFADLPQFLQDLYHNLLSNTTEFRGFFSLIKSKTSSKNLIEIITENFFEIVCTKKDLQKLIESYPCELAYCLSNLNLNDREALLPYWLIHQFPDIRKVLNELRFTNCYSNACKYCLDVLDLKKELKRYFNYSSFRIFEEDGPESLQEEVVQATLDGKSLLGIFPTGGGKSITYQLPALMIAKATKALTVIISPLQSLMFDQVENLKIRHSIAEAVTINGMLSPPERQKAIERIENGQANILYISPESLRSNTIINTLKKRIITRFVIDEAHCFSTWGHDFRVDYLYIAEFIKELRQETLLYNDIPISCFTATAKPQVVEDIKIYFRERLDIDIDVFISKAKRTNLNYEVYGVKTDQEKQELLVNLINEIKEPKIIYVSRTKRAEKLCKDLKSRGIEAVPFHGQMERETKIKNQKDFQNNRINTIVATSAFGMGVDKDDVGAVIHYEISNSLENYLQESGRAGRNPEKQARCIVLFEESDINKHFYLYLISKLNHKEISQIWNGFKRLTSKKAERFLSPLELAKEAGWETETKSDLETKVTISLAALEDVNLLKRKRNTVNVFANSFLINDLTEALDIVRNSPKLDGKDKQYATDIVKSLIRKSQSPETRIDHLADTLGMHIRDMMRIINILREEKILGDTKDLSCYLSSNSPGKAKRILLTYTRIENNLVNILSEHTHTYNIKDLNEKIRHEDKNEQKNIEESTITHVKEILLFWEINSYIKRERSEHNHNLVKITYHKNDKKALLQEIEKRHALCTTILEFPIQHYEMTEDHLVEFSLVGLLEQINQQQAIFRGEFTLGEMENSLLYLNAVGSIKLEGGFIVFYKRYNVERIEKNNKTRYTKEHYQKLDEFYENKIAQIHIAGEYVKTMMDDQSKAKDMVEDYFKSDFNEFKKKYFPNEKELLRRPLTRERYNEILGSLSPDQRKIIDDDNKKIIVAAGPGSGKTRVLVHKIASMLVMEDVKQEQFLMLTYSRAASMEFKSRVKKLIQGHVEHIYTFHSFCFELCGQVGNIDKSENIIRYTIDKIRSGDIPTNIIENKSVLVLDEFQDIGKDENELIQLIIEKADDIRVLAVGDDDQSIYGFRGASPKFMRDFEIHHKARRHELLVNFRSCHNLVEFSNQFLNQIHGRYKTKPIKAHTSRNGSIKIIKNDSPNLIPIVVNQFMESKIGQSTAVLTSTNEEALQVATELNKNGIRAKVILSNDHFSLYNLIEFRDLLNHLWLETKHYLEVISDEIWVSTLSWFGEKYKSNSNIEDLLAVLNKFDDITPQKSITELRSFLHDVRIEHCINTDEAMCVVSTMHKAKGLEFDHVLLLLQHHELENDEQRRTVYVAMTRAKKSLNIITRYPYFDNIRVDGLDRQEDQNQYDTSEEIDLILSLDQINLGFFKWEEAIPYVDKLKTEDPLSIRIASERYYLIGPDGKFVCQFAKDFVIKYKGWISKGYAFKSGKVQYIVKWFDQEDGKEYKVVLPIVRLEKNKT